MAQSVEVTELDPILYTQYNNLRKDVLDNSLGHTHSGNAEEGALISEVHLPSGKDIWVEMAIPSGVSAVAGDTGGTLVAGTYYYVVTASDGIGETAKSEEASATVDGSTTTKITISWNGVPGAAKYRVYGRSSGVQDQYWEVTTTSFTDDGTAGTAGAPPTITTAYVNKLCSSGNSWFLAGNIGIGTTSPGEILHINSSAPTIKLTGGVAKIIGESTQQLHIGPDGTYSTMFLGHNSAGSVYVGGVSDTVYPAVIYNRAGGYRWNIGPTEMMRMDSSGNVGIGTTAPEQKLQVAGNAMLKPDSGQPIIFLNNTLHTVDYALNAWSNRLEIRTDTAVSISDVVGGNQIWFNPTGAVYFNTGGNVGIGTTSPSVPLHVVGEIRADGSPNGIFSVDKDTSTDWNSLRFLIGGAFATGVWEIIHDTANALKFRRWTSATTFADDVIFDSGNVGIGVSPTEKLDVAGNINIGANKLKTTDLLIKQGWKGGFAIRDAADTTYKSLALNWIMPYAGFDAQSTIGKISAKNEDGAYIIGQVRDTGVGLVEIFRMAGADEPYFQMGPSAGALRVYNSGKIEALSDIEIGANKLKTTNLVLKEHDANPDYLRIRDAADTANKGLEIKTLGFTAGIGAWASPVWFQTQNTDGSYLQGRARQTGVGMVEIFRMIGQAEPRFQHTLPLNLKQSATLTIATGVITIGTANPGGFIVVDTEALAATDDLDTINGGATGDVICLKAADSTRTVVVKHGTGNLRLNGLADFSLDHADDTIILIYDGSSWLELSRSSNGA